MQDFRKAKIIQELKGLILDNPDFTVAQLLTSVLRSKNNRGEDKDQFFMSDEDVLVAVENTKKELSTSES